MITIIKTGLEEASCNHFAFTERQEPAQDCSCQAAEIGLLRYPFGVHACLVHGSTKHLRMACSRTEWLPSLTASAGQAGLGQAP